MKAKQKKLQLNKDYDIRILQPDQEGYDHQLFIKNDFDLSDEDIAAAGLDDFDYVFEDEFPDIPGAVDDVVEEALPQLDFLKNCEAKELNPQEEDPSDSKPEAVNILSDAADGEPKTEKVQAEALTDGEPKTESVQAEAADSEISIQEEIGQKSTEDKKQLIICHVLSIAFSAACLVLLVFFAHWFLFHIHPDFNPHDFVKGEKKYQFDENMTAFVLEEKAETLSAYSEEDHIIEKIYKISEDAVAALPPNPDCYGEVTYEEAYKIEQVINKAREYNLLEEEETVFQLDADFFKRGTIKYYLDETIMVICWKEVIEEKIVSLMEVKIKDVSQFRRKLTGDAYGSGVEMFCTQLSGQTNCVASCNADYYAFRNLGLSCYNGKVYRYGEQNYGGGKLYNCLDSLFIDGNGDFQFYERGTEMTKEEIETYMEEIGATFSVSFGPILVKHGEPQYNQYYPIGQITESYSRAGIGQVGKLHYVHMVVSNVRKGNTISTTDTFADIMIKKGAYEAYNLDGGQTGEYVFQGQVESLVDFGNERTVSDIIYFGSALPEEDWQSFTLTDEE